MPIRYIIITLLLALLQIPPKAQPEPEHRTFNLKSLGFKIGKMQAYHLEKEIYDYYVVNSLIDFISFKANVKTESLYENGILMRAIVTSTINKEFYISSTTWKKDHYDINCHARKYTYKDTTITRPITWSTGKMYFEIAEAGQEVYAENYGTLNRLQETRKNVLKMQTPESKQIYYYDKDNSKILKIEVVNNIKNFDMVPEN